MRAVLFHKETFSNTKAWYWGLKQKVCGVCATN